MSIIKSAKNGFEGLFNFFECLTQDFQSFFWRWKLPAFLVLGLLSNIALGQTYQFPNNLQVGGGFMMGTNEVSTVYTEGTKDPLLLTMKEVGDLSCESPTIYMTGGRLLILGCGVSNSQNYDKVFEIRKNNGDSFNAESVLLTPSTYRAFPTSPYELLFNVYLRGFKNNVQKGEIHLTNLVHAQNYPINFSNYAGFNDIDMLYIFVDNQDLFVDDLTLSPLAAVPVLPTLTTNSATGILSDRAVLGGNVTNDGGATISARGIVWSTSPNPTVTSNRVNMGTGSGSFSATVTGLPASSTVYVRSFAVNSAGTAYGNQISFTTPAKLVAQILSITGESCNGNDGSASIGAIGGTPPYSFLWEFDNSTLSSRNDLTAGTYTIRVSDSAGDRSTAIVNLGAQAPLNISLNLSQVSCFGGSNGAASVTVTGGTGVYTYTWSVAGQSGSRIENLTAGSYSITVRDQSGCQSVQNFTITEPSMLSASVTSVTDATCIGGNNGAAQISVSGGTPPYTYSWSPSGGSSPAIFNVSAGTYQVLIRDANFCEVTQTVTIREPNLPLLVSTNSATEVLSTSARISGSATQDLSGFGESESCVSKVGFVYSTTSNPEIGNGTVAYVNPFTLSGFSGLLLNLRPNSVYYARAFVENSTGSVTYGNEQSFTTAPLNLSIGGSFSVSPKTYDGNSTATISFYSLVLSGLNPSFNRVGLEDVVVEFETAEAGINKPVRIVSANITGPDASSYNFSLLNSPTSTGTILKRNLSITGLTASSKTYDGTTNAVVTGTPVLSGVLDGDDVTLSGTPEYDFVTSNAGQAIEIGVTGISLSGSEASNYELFPPVWFGDILRRQLLMGDPSITVQKVFDGTRQASFVLGAPLNLVTGDEVVVTGSAQYEDANVGVGKQIVLTYGVSGNAASNYLAPVPFTRTDGEITPADLRITVSSETKVFGELDPVFTLQYSGFVFGDDVSVVVGTPVFSRDPEENVGNYPVVVSGLSSANYAVQLVPGNLEITQRRIQVTMPFLSKSYGDVDPALTYTTAPALGTVLPNGIRVELNGSLQREPGEDVGDYRIDIGTIKDLNPNYLIGYVGGLLSIVPKEVRVSADSKSKTYGDLDPAFTYTSIPGEGEELANGLRVSFTGELERQPGEAVGTYVISRGTLSNPNFNIVFQNGQLEITPLSVEVRADAKTKVYGELDPTLTYSTLPALGTVLSNGEILSLSGVLNRMEGEDVGRYAIGVGTLNHPNLSLRYVGSELEITRRQVVVTAEGKTKVFGEIDPALTYGSVPAIASVLPNGEVVSFAGSLTREPGEEVGTYPISLGSLTNPNYSVVFNGADLEIQPLTLVVSGSFTAKSKGYDGTVSAEIESNNLQLSGLVTGFNQVSLENVVVEFEDSDAGIGKVVRIVSADLTGPDAGNYSLTLTNSPFATASILKKGLTLTGLTASSKTYDGTTDAVVTGTPVLSEVLDGDDVTLSGTPEYDFVTSNAGQAIEIGVTGISLSGSEASNYELFPPVWFADILRRQLLMGDPSITVQKVFDGTRQASFVLGAPLNLVTGDEVVVTGSAQYEDANVGVGKQIVLTYGVSGNAASNYLAPVPFTRTDGEITPADLRITVSSETKVFGELDPVFTLQYSGFVVGDDISVVVGTPVFSRDPEENVGNYPVVVSGLSSANYAVQLVPGNLEITQRRIQVTMDFLSKSYGDVDPALTYSTAPVLGTVLPNGIRVELNGSLQREPGEDVGDYRIDIGTIKDLNPNYLIGYVGGLLSIVPKEVRVSADSKSKTYGDLDPAFTYTSIPGEGEELANGLRVSFTGELERQPGEAVGTYIISRGTLSNPNFNIVFQNGQLEITPLSVEVRADAQTKVYGELDPTLTYSTLPALGTVLSNGEILSLSGVLNRMEGEDVGRYAIGVGTLNHPNLTLRYVGSELEITRRQVVVTAEGKTKVFGEIDPALTYGSVPAIASVLPNGEVVSFAGSLTREPGEEVGTYPIRLGSLTNPNYSVVFNGADLEITPLSVTVNADSQQKIYGDLDPEFKFLSIPSLGTILPNGSILSFSGKLSREAGENVGSYAIELGNLTNPNYVISYIGGELEIKPLPIKVTANNQSKAFGELDPQLTYASVPAAGSILENGQVVSFLGTLDREPGENVGNYPIKQGSLTNPNYQIDFISGILTINPFKVRIVANAGSKVYGENDPSLTFTSSIQPESTLPNGQVFTLTGSLSRNPGENVGTYSINQGNLNSPNIQFEFVGADFTIQPKSLEIVPLGNQRKVYGEPDPDFQFRVNGLLPRDPSSIISGDISRVQGEDVNAYKFTLGNLSAGPNYSLILKEEVFKIEPKALILRAGNKEKRYGDPNPELTYTFEGLANGDTGIDQLPTISTSANQSSSVGIYPIRLTGGLDRNYSLTLINGELRVLKRSILVKANDQEMIYGDQVPSLTYQYVGLVNGDRDLETNPSVETIASSNSNVGTYPIRVSGGADRNYELAYQNGLLTIRPRELQVVADSKMREFGDLNPVLTYTLSGLVNKDNDLTVRPVLSLSANQSSVVGTYPIGISGGSHPNYSLVYKEGVLEILPAKLTVTAQPASKVFGANDPDLSFSATGFKLSDGIGLGIGKLNRPAGEAVGTYPIGIGSLSFGVNYMVRFEGADFKIVPVEILAYNELAEIQTPWGIVPELPDEVQIVTQDARIISVQVNWASNELNVFAKGVYFIKGEILETGDIKNPEGISPTLKVTVLPKPSSEDLILSNNRFIPDPDNFFQAIGNFRVIDPVDNVHSISLVQQELDNGFFEIKENILFWSSADQASGKSQFTIRVQVKDRDGNTLIKDFTILRERVVLESLEVYNSFSPNGDGFNDTWGVPDLRYYKNVRVHIFNKEGRRVFYTENPDFRWDGSFEDVELATDTFQWVIEIKETGEKRNGTLHLIR
ncbi:MAG: gliding motility-associated C-terminal domain-containing protein [Flavobacteriales bacterium]|nr:gliding motility-associated C-terminal domain-containing protein [Flavobacteriales bacterium]